ncbi:MAG: retropepsin-like aspartic protease [Verrucomicrobiota bacterium]
MRAPIVAQADPAPDVVPFEFKRGRIMVPVRVNDSEPLSFLLDTGYTLMMINPEHARALELKRVGHITVAGIAGEEKADLFQGTQLKLGNVTFTPRRLAALPSDERNRKRDGVLGHGLFKQFVVEIDFKKSQLKLHDPQAFKYAGTGERLPLSFNHTTTPLIDARLVRQDGREIKGRFELDTGCTGTMCIGHDFVEANELLEPEQKTRDSSRGGVGGGVSTRVGRLKELRFGSKTVAHPEANFFLEGSPVDHGLAGHIGIQALRRFRVFLDYSRKEMILEPRD